MTESDRNKLIAAIQMLLSDHNNAFNEGVRMLGLLAGLDTCKDDAMDTLKPVDVRGRFGRANQDFKVKEKP